MLTRTPALVQNLDDNNQLSPLREFNFQDFSYLNNGNARWKNAGGGRYDAGAFNNGYALRGMENAMPAACLAGGPGSSLTSDYKNYFNHKKFRVVLSDWRGVGTSQPQGPYLTNNAQGLIDDIETMRKKLGSEKLMLLGGSWGATMAMGYAQAYPERVSGLVLRLPFLASEKDSEWNYAENGMARNCPKEYDMFREAAGNKTDPKEIVQIYNDNLQSLDVNVQKKAYLEWSRWEYARSGEVFDLTEDMLDPASPSYQARLNRAQIMAYYAANDFFLNKEGILGPDACVPDVPVIIAANANDPLQRPDTLDILRRNFPNAEMIVQENADWHWIFNPAEDGSFRSNAFIKNACAYAAEKIRRINEGQDLKLVR